MTIIRHFRSAGDQPFRSTDYPNRPVYLRVNRTTEEVRAAALDSVTIHCGWCSGHWPDNPAGRDAFRNHKCTDAAGRDLTSVKILHAEGAHRARLALKRFSIPPCEVCGKTDMRPGEQHTCSAPKTMMPVDIDAANFQRQGAAAALKADLGEMKKATS